MRPLILPKLVAARSSASSLPSPADERAAAQYPESTHSAASECSTPLSQTFSAHGHLRYSSSASSLSSTPPSHDHLDSMSSSNKLPQLAEEPCDELDDGFDMFCDEPEMLTPCFCDVDVCAHQSSIASDSTASLAENTEGPGPELSERYSLDDYESISPRQPKRRTSGDSPVNSIASRFGERFPSLTRRWNSRRTPSTLAREGGRVSMSGAPSSRSSSMTGSMFPHFDTPSETALPPSPARSLDEEAEYDMLSASPEDFGSTILSAEEPIDREALASTPLLPPMMLELRSVEQTPLQSPLQSPTIADANATFSAMNSPLGAPQVPGVPTPPLSTRPSVASFKHSRPGNLVPLSEIPPMTIEDPQDEWALKLGHANFTIFPEPYEPDVCDAAACRELFANWEQARRNFTKHQLRTGEHFGVTSKTYLMTEEKWSEIDGRWKRNHDWAVARAADMGLDLEEAPTPTEPVPLMKMPSLNGKFPKLGDEDVVGPMIQVAAKIPSPSRKVSWMRFFSDVKFPGSFLGRTSSLGAQPSR